MYNNTVLEVSLLVCVLFPLKVCIACTHTSIMYWVHKQNSPYEIVSGIFPVSVGKLTIGKLEAFLLIEEKKLKVFRALFFAPRQTHFLQVVVNVQTPKVY